MGIEVESDRDRTVSKPLLGHLGMDALLEQLCSMGMPKVMETDPWNVHPSYEVGEAAGPG